MHSYVKITAQDAFCVTNSQNNNVGKNFVLSFEDDVGGAFQKACNHDDDSHPILCIWCEQQGF